MRNNQEVYTATAFTHRVLLACERASVAAKSASEGSLRLPPRLGAGLACAPPYLASSASMKLLACCPLPRMAATNAWQRRETWR